MSLKTIGSGSQRGFWCIQEVIEKCSHANVCKFQHILAKESPRTGPSEGSCKFLHERFGGKRGSWWIQQRGALRWRPRPSGRARAPPARRHVGGAAPSHAIGGHVSVRVAVRTGACRSAQQAVPRSRSKTKRGPLGRSSGFQRDPRPARRRPDGPAHAVDKLSGSPTGLP